MPQLDLTTYLTNLFWLIVVFFAFYVLVVKTILPILLKAFLFRKYFADLQLDTVYQNKNVYEFYITKFQFIETFSLNALNTILADYVYFSYFLVNRNLFSALINDYSALSIYNTIVDKDESLIEVYDFNVNGF